MSTDNTKLSEEADDSKADGPDVAAEAEVGDTASVAGDGDAEIAEVDPDGDDDSAVAEVDAEVAEVDADGDDDTAVPDAAPAKPRQWGRILAGVLGALLIASAGLTAWLYFDSYRTDQAVGSAAADRVLETAKEATVAVLSYSPESLDQDLDAAKSQLTGDFLTYYTQFTDQVVRPAVKTKQVSTTANVVQAAVSEMHPEEAKVLMFVNQTTTSSDRTEPSMTASSVVVTMKKIDGKWLISAFDPV